MMTILKIDSSITGESSVSRQLTAAVVSQLGTQNLDQRLVSRDLVASPAQPVFWSMVIWSSRMTSGVRRLCSSWTMSRRSQSTS